MGFLNSYAHDLGGGNDPFIASVVQLAHFNGANGGTSPFTNSCARGNTITSTTGAVLSTTQVKYGATALRIGSLAQNVTAATHADYNFAGNDWAVEFFVRPDALGTQVFFDMRVAALTAAWVPSIYMNTVSGDIRYFANGADRIVGANGSITALVWQHIAAARVSGTTNLFVDGTSVGSFVDSNTYVQSNLFMGSAANTASGARGYYDDLRMTNGAGRYSGNFTAPLAELPNF